MGAIEDLFAQATTPSQSNASATQQLLLVQALMQQKAGNGDAHKSVNKGGGPGGSQNVGGKLVIKPRPVPRGYKPPLDRWHGIQMQPAAINSLQSYRRGAAVARHAVSSYRPYAEQARIYASGVRPAATPGSSYHQQGLAIDDPWITAHPSVRAWLLHHGWNSGQSFGDPSHYTFRVTG